jgi:protein-L-isoaspartate O-methyltransferase
MPRADEHGDAPPQFDRIIATFPVSEPPAEWLDMLAPGGRLVAFADGNGGVVIRERAADGVLVPAGSD